MSNNNLFSQDNLKIIPARSGFDLSGKNCFTAKVGELLPVFSTFVLPGDKFEMKVEHFTRTAEVETAAFTRIKEYFDWFFVPLSLLWKGSEQSIMMMYQNPVQALTFGSNVQVSSLHPALKLSQLVGPTTGQYSVLGVLADLPHGHLSPQSAKPLKNYMGYNRANLSAKLMSYLNYGRFLDGYIDSIYEENAVAPYAVDLPVNLYPLAAYQKIYSDYYRDSNWENAVPYTYNFDYWNGASPFINLPSFDDDYWQSPTMFDLRYCNWQKDLFFGIKPNSQLGDVATVKPIVSGTDATINKPAQYIGFPQFNLTLDGPTNFVKAYGSIPAPNGTDKILALQTQSDVDIKDFSSATVLQGTANGTARIPAQTLTNIQGLQAEFSVLMLRKAEFLQRWKEVAQSGRQDYASQIYKQWGVEVPEGRSNACTLIAGDVSQIDISEVVSSNIDVEAGNYANIAGKGTGAGRSTTQFNAREYGVLMCIYHAVPLLDYDISGIDLQLTKTESDDFALPVFDRLGMQELPFYALCNDKESFPSTMIDSTTPLGYVPRYVEYKTNIDRIHGAFCDTLKNWVAPLNTEMIVSLLNNSLEITYGFFKVDPKVLNPIFGVAVDSTTATDQLRVNSYFDVKLTRNLDYDGMPY